MLVINADDLGRSRAETDAALACFHEGRLTSASAMVLMEDSERAAERVRECGLDVGLHLNLSQSYNGRTRSRADEAHRRIVRFMTRSKYAVLLYHPGLRRDFRDDFHAQMDEFVRLYGKTPSHVDGHQHRHICANVLWDEVIPRGQRVRRNFSFFPGEKATVNRVYRKVVDGLLGRRYRLTDYFFALPDCWKAGRLSRLALLAKTKSVELMTHPVRAEEFAFLMGDTHKELLRELQLVTYAAV
jgi:predicted glycoside hydrolase/deacetylase ChbG (UPF0249 family)